MNDVFKIAWRNLWRNKRRTLITAASIFFAVFFAIFMRSFQLGTYGYMIEQSIEAYTGYLQIQDPAYFDDPSIENAFSYTDSLKRTIEQHPNVVSLAPRIESFALASTGNLSKGVLISGIDPKAELAVSDPANRLVSYRFSDDALAALAKSDSLPSEMIARLQSFRGKSYASEAKIELDLELNSDESKTYLPLITKHAAFNSAYLKADDEGILLSDRLSRYLKASVGDSIILIGQGYHGVSAAGIFPVRGVVTMSSPDLDNKLIYMSTQRAAQFLGFDQQLTSVIVSLRDNEQMKTTQKELMAKLDGGKYAVKNWEELAPTLKQQIEGDNVGGQVFLFILYVIVFFGIFGTVIMMIAERQREFAVMIAIGMKRRKLSLIIALETLFIGIIGTLAGMLAISPFLLYGHYNPIRLTGDIAKMYEDMGFDALMPMALFDSYFFMQGLVILLMIILAALIPVRSINRLKVINALHG